MAPIWHLHLHLRLQEQPDLIQLAAETREDDRGEPREEELVAVISLGYQPDMARIALRNEGSVEAAVEALMAGMGTVQDKKRKVSCSTLICLNSF